MLCGRTQVGQTIERFSFTSQPRVQSQIEAGAGEI